MKQEGAAGPVGKHPGVQMALESKAIIFAAEPSSDDPEATRGFRVRPNGLGERPFALAGAVGSHGDHDAADAGSHQGAFLPGRAIGAPAWPSAAARAFDRIGAAAGSGLRTQKASIVSAF